jgi:hypothetical protein
MGEAKRRKQLEIEHERAIWSDKISKLQEWVSELEAIVSLTEEEEEILWHRQYDLESYRKELARLLELSELSDQELHKMYSNQGFIG